MPISQGTCSWSPPTNPSTQQEKHLLGHCGCDVHLPPKPRSGLPETLDVALSLKALPPGALGQGCGETQSQFTKQGSPGSEACPEREMVGPVTVSLPAPLCLPIPEPPPQSQTIQATRNLTVALRGCVWGGSGLDPPPPLTLLGAHTGTVRPGCRCKWPLVPASNWGRRKVHFPGGSEHAPGSPQR